MSDALKVLSLLRRRAGLDAAGFSRHWRTTHKAHALALVRAGFFRGYIQNHAHETQPEGLQSAADGMPELWIDDPSALERLAASREYREGAGPDEANFVQPPVLSCIARERVLAGLRHADLPAGAIKLILLAMRPPERPPARFEADWLAGENDWWGPTHAPLRLTRQVAVETGAPSPFDGADCSWWPDAAAAQQAWRATAAHARRIAGPLRGLLVIEDVVLPPST